MVFPVGLYVHILDYFCFPPLYVETEQRKNVNLFRRTTRPAQDWDPKALHREPHQRGWWYEYEGSNQNSFFWWSWGQQQERETKKHRTPAKLWMSQPNQDQGFCYKIKTFFWKQLSLWHPQFCRSPFFICFHPLLVTPTSPGKKSVGLILLGSPVKDFVASLLDISGGSQNAVTEHIQQKSFNKKACLTYCLCTKHRRGWMGIHWLNPKWTHIHIYAKLSFFIAIPPTCHDFPHCPLISFYLLPNFVGLSTRPQNKNWWVAFFCIFEKSNCL